MVWHETYRSSHPRQESPLVASRTILSIYPFARLLLGPDSRAEASLCCFPALPRGIPYAGPGNTSTGRICAQGPHVPTEGRSHRFLVPLGKGT